MAASALDAMPTSYENGWKWLRNMMETLHLVSSHPGWTWYGMLFLGKYLPICIYIYICVYTAVSWNRDAPNGGFIKGKSHKDDLGVRPFQETSIYIYILIYIYIYIYRYTFAWHFLSLDSHISCKTRLQKRTPWENGVLEPQAPPSQTTHGPCLDMDDPWISHSLFYGGY